MAVNIKSAEKNGKGQPASEDKIREHIENMRDAVEDFKSNYPIEISTDERVKQAIEQYEAAIGKREKQLEKVMLQYKPE